MIPKIIHYCWFGKGPHSELMERCISSWKKYCPDYEIVEWNESNFDVNYNDFTREAFEAKKYAFVSDVARLVALLKYGGIYLDTDMEVLCPIDDVLQYDGVVGFHDFADNVGTAIMGCVKDFPLFREFLSLYDGLRFKRDDGSLALVPNNNLLTEMCLRYGLKKDNITQTVNGLTVLPSEYFYPKNSITKELKLTDNTLAIHHFDGSWYSDIKDYKMELRKRFPFLPQRAVSFLAYLKLRGFSAAVSAAKRLIDEKKKRT